MASSKVEVRSSKLGVARFFVPPGDMNAFNALPDQVREDINDKLLAFEIIHGSKNKTQAAANQAVEFAGRRGFSERRLYVQYFAYVSCGCDWRLLIDKAQAKQCQGKGQPREFILFWWSLVARHKRSKNQARHELLRIWRTGRNLSGEKCEVPGYGNWQQWFSDKNPHEDLPSEAPLPSGWSKAQLYRLKPLKVQDVLAREGSAAARKYLPDAKRTRTTLRFLEHITFDDVKTDWRVFDPASKQVVDLWLLVAIDTSTGLVLAYWPLPAVERPDGKVTHISQAEMKQLCGWLLERWGVPVDYCSTWKMERGTATVAEAVAMALRQLFNDRITVSYSTMISGKGASGYEQRAVGNSRGKAGHESANNLFHNMCDHLPAQTGPHYSKRPADLWGREAHVRDCVKLMEVLPHGHREKVKLPVLTLDEARGVLNETFNRMNCRTDHQLEGYEFQPVWRYVGEAEWKPIASYPDASDTRAKETNEIKQSPLERAKLLSDGVEFQKVDNSALVRFYSTSQKLVTVTEKGVIEFKERDVDYEFRPAAENHLQSPFIPGAKFLAYFNTATKSAIHLTQLPPHNGYVATWSRWTRAGYLDAAAAEAQIRYHKAARNAQEQLARELAGDEAAKIAEIDRHNAALLADSKATDITSPSALATDETRMKHGLGSNPTVRAMDAVDAATRDIQEQAARVNRVDVAQEILNRPAVEQPEADQW